MPLGRCVNGHMYRVEKYGNKCPYCDSSLDGATKKISKPMDMDDPDKTRVSDDIDGIEPVVGWLVCIEGPQYGKDYRLRQGKNFIGRSDEMDVSIVGDNTISRKNHAAIVYDPKTRKFLLIPGEGSGLVYLSNQVNKEAPILAATEINAYDVIEIGKSKFIFINLCGQHFDWVK